MGVSYNVKDETIDRLVDRNRELRDELERVKSKNAELAKKINELHNENDILNLEIDSYRSCIRTLVDSMSGVANKISDTAERMRIVANAIDSTYLKECS